MYLKLPPVQLPIFWASSPTPLFCSTAQSVWSSAIIRPWLPMRFLRALSSRTKAISADGVKVDVVAVQQEKWLSSAF
ncbi:putative transposase [Neisseria meningitidis NM36]|nr:putative transposase [Neisseria meningitidis NM36]